MTRAALWRRAPSASPAACTSPGRLDGALLARMLSARACCLSSSPASRRSARSITAPPGRCSPIRAAAGPLCCSAPPASTASTAAAILLLLASRGPLVSGVEGEAAAAPARIVRHDRRGVRPRRAPPLAGASELSRQRRPDLDPRPPGRRRRHERRRDKPRPRRSPAGSTARAGWSPPIRRSPRSTRRPAARRAESSPCRRSPLWRGSPAGSASPSARAAIAADGDHDVDLWVRAAPEGDEVALAITGWAGRPAQSAAPAPSAGARGRFPARRRRLDVGDGRHAAADRALARRRRRDRPQPRRAGRQAAHPPVPLSREDEDGALPILTALAEHKASTTQLAELRGGRKRPLCALRPCR